MPDGCKTQDQHHLGGKRLTPTDIAQYLRLGECPRYLKLRMYEREHGSGFLREFGLAPQPIPPLLTLAGQQFERQVEAQARGRFRVVNCARDEGGEGDATGGPDNALLVGHASSLAAGDTLLLFQPRVEARLGEWPFAGDLDILRLHRDHGGKLHILIADMKATRRVKVEHRLQVAFYHEMLCPVFAQALLAHEPIRLGVLYRGPQQGEPTTDAQQVEHEAARALLAVDGAFLELIAGGEVEDYRHEIRDLVTGPDSVAARAARVRLADAPFHLGLRCDGCLYNEFCMKDACLRADLSLVPTLTAREKRTLLTHGVADIYDLGGLMRFAKQDEDVGEDALLVKAKHRDRVRTLRATALGPRLEELVHRARAVVAAREREQARTRTGAGADTKSQAQGAAEGGGA